MDHPSHGPFIPRTMYDKIWDEHVVTCGSSDDADLIFVDRHLVHEVSSPQAFEGLRLSHRSVRRPDCTLATVDHNIPTESRSSGLPLQDYVHDPESRAQCLTLEKNAKKHGIMYFGLHDLRQGIVHVIGAEQGFTLPGTVCVCGDSHTSTLGAFGSLAFGIGTSEVEHVLATQTLSLRKSKTMRITVDGVLQNGVTAKDVILHIISILGTAGGTGYVIEYAGSVVRSFSMESRMTMCNMTIEAGARAGLIAPDEITLEYLRNRPLSPAPGDAFAQAESHWRSLCSDEAAVFDVELHIQSEDIAPTVTWGTSPEDNVPITGRVPNPQNESHPQRREAIKRSLEYMGLVPDTPMEDITLNKIFIGSCTNSRIEDLRSAVGIIRAFGPDAKVAPGVFALVVPGSGLVKRQAEAEGLDVILKRAGFVWREAGCSMCIGLNPDRLSPGERCGSTSNRNFKGRQGPGGRTHLLSPAMAAVAALTGRLTDVRKYSGKLDQKLQPNHVLPSLLYMNDPPKDSPELPDLSQPDSVAYDISDVPSNVEPRRTQFTSVKGFVAPLFLDNVDTDVIIPAHLLKGLTRTGLGSGLFYGLRRDAVTGEQTDFILNRYPYSSARILVCTGPNFGCGSSREHAAWSLKDFGISCIIAPSFSDIFFNNCLQNGILTITLSPELCGTLANVANEGFQLEVDLTAQQIKQPETESPPIDFKIDASNRERLLQGIDDIETTLMKDNAISLYEQKRREVFPWIEIGDRNWKHVVRRVALDW